MQEKRGLLISLTFPLLFVTVLWSVHVLALLLDTNFAKYGLQPQSLYGLPGIVTSPFLHGSFSHLGSNSIPLLVLGTALFYFYREVAIKVFIYGLFITGLWVWVMARPTIHIGASGIVYCLAAFLFVSGIIRRYPRLMALSLLVVFLYGGLVWGIFPLREQVSWESHLMGMLAGIVLAFFYKDHGPQRPVYSWEMEDDQDQPEIPGGEAGEEGQETELFA